MSGSQSDPERLFDALREASPPAPLPALIVPEPTRSVRGGPIGPLVTGARRAILRIIAPSLVELTTAIDAVPPDGGSLAFRTFGPWA